MLAIQNDDYVALWYCKHRKHRNRQNAGVKGANIFYDFGTVHKEINIKKIEIVTYVGCNL